MRAEELSTAEALDLVSQLARAGIEEVTLIGGEAFLRKDWLEIARAIADHGMLLEMATGGYGISATTAHRMKEAGFELVSVSIDGLEDTHDELRGRAGSFAQCFAALGHLRQAGIVTAVNSQVNRLSAPELPRLYERVVEAGVHGWQLGLTVPMGRAADRPEILLQPAELVELYEVLAALAEQAREDGLRINAGNNVGYYGPYELLLRGHPQTDRIWQGCQAGVGALGIEADGGIKGCPSLPSASYLAGNVRERSLASMLRHSEELAFNLHKTGTRDGLWGRCADCQYAPLCGGGCNWTAHVFFGRRGNNVYCHHRALELRRQGRRERVVRERGAPGRPFDHGCFAIVEEPAGAAWPEPDPLHFTLERVQWPSRLARRRAVTEERWRARLEQPDREAAGPTTVHRPPTANPKEMPPSPSTRPSPLQAGTRGDAPAWMHQREAFASPLDRIVTVGHARRRLSDTE